MKAVSESRSTEISLLERSADAARSRGRWTWCAATLTAVLVLAAQSIPPLAAQAVTTGPPAGALIVAGGGGLGPEIMDRFIELAGGSTARIVVIPTAGESNDYNNGYGGADRMRRLGAAQVTVLHTRDPKIADSEEFVAPLLDATGVWIPGGRQWRLADTYLGTRTVQALFGVLERGGVIGGSSAGASIQASYMVRGAPEGNTIMMAPGHEEGFGFMTNAAVDQHLLVRGRQDDMLAVIERYPHLLGVGLDEGTAIEVSGDSAVVIGASLAAFYNARDGGGQPYYFLQAGDVFDLEKRAVRQGKPQPPDAADARAALRVVQRLFAAMLEGDSAAIRRSFHPQARLTSVSAGMDGQNTVRPSNVDEFVARIARSPGADERMVDPEVKIAGDLVSVWTYYEFWQGDEFRHCGTDSFQLVRANETWRIIDITYTVRRDGCAGR